MTIATGSASLSTPTLLVIMLVALLMVRFNRRLARAHGTLFGASGRALRRWEMVLLRLLWLIAGWTVFIVALVSLIDHS
jgi:hypothetical protein